MEQFQKAELHLHLEGSLEPETIRELSPATSLDEIEQRYNFTGFLGFIDAFKWVAGFLNTPEDYALATRRLLESLHRQNVVYAELTLAAGVALWRKLDFAAIYQAVVREAALSPVEVRWVLDCIRHFGPEHGMDVARLAVERAGDGVVAFGIGGDEARGPARWFKDVVAFTRDHGLRFVPHAGETTDAQSIWEAVELGADRIGHGIRAIDDPRLVQYLKDRDIPLEISITSNVSTGAVASLADHPVRKLYELGVPIILNTDDPAIFHTTLDNEYRIAADQFGFTEDQLRNLAADSLQRGIFTLAK